LPGLNVQRTQPYLRAIRARAPGLALMGEASAIRISHATENQREDVRNHASNVFDKLGVWSRTQAIVFARDRGFTANGRE
jgi:hypothetical protein